MPAMPASATQPRSAPVPVQQEYARSGDVRPEYTAAPESQILDKWKDSGQPLR
jgi:hypothetical protein